MRLVTYSERLLVERHRGTMPVLLTCPHDGTVGPPKVGKRQRPATPSGGPFKTARDTHTAMITASVAQTILNVSGLSPYVVIARFARTHIDANRPASLAFTDENAGPYYNSYHDTITDYVAQILEENRTGFLFDIHGTSVVEVDPADIYIGTADGASLLPGFDRNVLFMRHGLHGLLRATRHGKGQGGSVLKYRVSPANSNVKETTAVSGGFTVKNYSDRLNCVQIELAETLRMDSEKRVGIVEALAYAIVNCTRRHVAF